MVLVQKNGDRQISNIGISNPKTGSFFLPQDEARVQIDFLLNPHEDDKMYYKTRWFTH